jgi:hypothetical protein
MEWRWDGFIIRDGRREFYGRGELGGLEREINSGIYSAPGGCRGFGLGGLGHPLMS